MSKIRFIEYLIEYKEWIEANEATKVKLIYILFLYANKF